MAGLYIHIPFCSYKCHYCDFYSGNQIYLIEDYVSAVVLEIELRRDYIENQIINTIYFGGGTPSLLTKQQLYRILKSIFYGYNVDTNCEITIECNPENISSNYLNDLYELKFNRISLGIQFLKDDVLKKFNRHHSIDLIFNALNIINNSRITNLSIDLIYNVPGVSGDFLINSLEQLILYDIKHVSAYSLTIAKNSKLFWKIRKGELVENLEDEFLTQYSIINNFLKLNGFIQYEVSNYGREGYFSYHNMSYWNQIPYLGIGVSAHSYNLRSRQWNHTNIKKYIKDLIGGDGFNLYGIEYLDENQLYNEYIILRLRTFQGISFNYIKINFANSIFVHFKKNVEMLNEKGHFIIEGDTLIPSDSDLLVSDYLAQFLML